MSLTAILPGRRGFGTAPLGNMFRAIPEEEVHATLEAAWEQGTRYYDTAPFYGAGLAEARLGTLLATKPRDSFVLSTKVAGSSSTRCRSAPASSGTRADCSSTAARTG
ncbi:aldo/keto reductase [Herbidospora galbida]|uniref:aldo/keto reductase n=1 Tax=Herbidospora galbida TaxID=2575442 RepID=UPI001BAE5FA2|nr:aldo/keto reductase [Herbidospora galbida]